MGAESLKRCAPDCGVDREGKMVRVAGGAFCDPCIASIVDALNRGGLRTIASCCGHGRRPGNIVLDDGRELVIAAHFAEARRIDALFPGDIDAAIAGERT